MDPPRPRGMVPSLYLTAVLFKSFVHSMLCLFSSHGLMLLISFVDVTRTLVVEEIEAQVTKAYHEHDALIKHLVGLTIEADVPFVRQEILDALDRIEAYVYNFEFKGIVMCFLDALSKLYEVKDIKVLKESEHDVCL